MKSKSLKKVLFLCTGNSCRSQMAEAIVNDRLGDQWLAVSAGTKPSGYVHPKAIQVLADWDIIHLGESKLADQFRNWDFDLVVTVCDSAAEECPVWLGQGVRVHHSFPDPAEATGSEEEILGVFKTVRDAIAKEIIELLQQFSP
jgi:arsenate reductase (thioredoxin)